MQRKHYPLLTILGAVVLTAAPLLLWFVFSPDQASDPDFQSPLESVAGATVPQDADVVSSVIPKTGPSDVSRPLPAKTSDHVAPSGNPAAAATHVTEAHPGPPTESREMLALGTDAGADRNSGHVPVPPEAAIMPDSVAPMSFQSTETDNDILDVPTLPVVSDTYYQATGHLAMTAISEVAKSGVSEATARSESESRDAVSKKSATSAEHSRPSRSRRSKTVSPVIAEAPSAMPPGKPGTAMADMQANGGQPVTIEDVIVQTPLETAPVGRMENVVAMTRASGWPIALVRSDLPDDVWWVQQMVGIQGNSFAARVNFGNEYSLSGTGYRMVIVFLDSPDEVRRFRIAKQFKVIPEGTRRSREFHYIRK